MSELYEDIGRVIVAPGSDPELWYAAYKGLYQQLMRVKRTLPAVESDDERHLRSLEQRIGQYNAAYVPGTAIDTLVEAKQSIMKRRVSLQRMRTTIAEHRLQTHLIDVHIENSVRLSEWRAAAEKLQPPTIPPTEQ